MNQSEFDGTSADRLETLITCQRESTELEKMLIARLVYVEELADDTDGGIAILEGELYDANGEIDALQESLDDADEKLDGIRGIVNEAKTDCMEMSDILEIIEK